MVTEQQGLMTSESERINDEKIFIQSKKIKPLVFTKIMGS